MVYVGGGVLHQNWIQRLEKMRSQRVERVEARESVSSKTATD
jgi:hypothetical protein